MSVDLGKLARVMQKLAGEVQALQRSLEERTAALKADVEEDVRNKLDRFAVALDDKIVGPGFATLEAQTQQLREENENLRADVAYLQALLAGHEVALIGLTGQPTEPVFPGTVPGIANKSDTTSEVPVDLGTPLPDLSEEDLKRLRTQAGFTAIRSRREF